METMVVIFENKFGHNGHGLEGNPEATKALVGQHEIRNEEMKMDSIRGISVLTGV
jgi:hypothetical protein